ncbi:MAG: hypothetical protein HDT30_11285 [Clostridiales bacterium]|nr:hypothetical protein [Clostridiales bacterium]
MISEKEFEEIYRKIKEEETPDLWDRIETELEEIPPQKKNTKKWIISLSTLAAAILIFLVASPLFSMVKERQKDTKTNNFNGVEGIFDTNSLAEDKTEKVDNSTDKENTSMNSVEMNEKKDEMPVQNDESGSFTDSKESLEQEAYNNGSKEISTLTIKGTLLCEVNREKIEGLEEVKEKQLPDEFQKVTEELKKKEKKQKYYRDMNQVYYVEIEDKLYRIFI